MVRPILFLCLILLSASVHAQIDLQLTRISDRASVTDIKHAGDGSNRLFLVNKFGFIEIYRNGSLLATPFLDIRSIISRSGEQGLLSMAFPPDYAQSGVFYVYYTDLSGFSTIARYRVSDDADVADPESAEVLLTEQQPFTNHNGGRLEFGPDGMLYLGIGDGGDANDPFGNGQDLRTLLGSLIRIDVSQESGYSVPPDNPFLGQADARDEIWAYGLRNPWRMAFDSMTGDLFIADVGQDNIEEINVQPASSGGGENYGWALFEGCVSGSCDGTVVPAFTYDHSAGDCSITGGQVYRGPDYPALQGLYVYGDFCTGRVWGLDSSSFQNQLLLDTGTLSNVTTFGEDQRGNIYVAGSLGVESGVFLISDGPPVQSNSIAIDGSLSGTYVVQGLNDQGFFVTVGSNESGSFVFIAWFTFDASGSPRWLVGVDFYEPGASSITLTMQEVSGLPFLDFSDNTASRNDFGSMTFTAVECGLFQADYDFGANGSGSLTLDRLTNIEGRDCAASGRR